MRIPTYRLHKGTGQAIVRLAGVDVYLGKYGSVESREKYRRLLAEYLASGRAPAEDEDEPITIGECLIPYLTHVDQHYRLPDGSASNQGRIIRYALKPLRRLYQDTPARDFGPLKLKTVRAEFVREGLSRNEINRRTSLIRKFLRWCAGEELIPAVNIEALRCVPGLERGRTEAVETEPVKPVSDDVVDATIAHAPPVIAAMIQTQRLTGMRPAEVCALTTGAIDRTTDVWEYRPARHKTAHHGHSRAVLVGPRGQEVLKPWLREDAPDAPLFSPAARMADLSAERREGRQTPLWPSHKAAQEAKRPRRRKRGPRDRYDAGSYRRAVQVAAVKAGVEPWAPNRLRHSAATRLRAAAGLDVAGTVLGHADLSTTELYAERDLQAARDVIAKLG
jgi:integrase